MKNFKISLALLAVVFAVGSAFTTFGTDEYRIFANKGQVVINPVPAPATIPTDTRFTPAGTVAFSVPALNAFALQHCIDEQPLCFVAIKYTDGVLQSQSLAYYGEWMD